MELSILKIFICSAIFLFQISVAQAQTFNPGLPSSGAPPPPAAAPASGSGGATNASGAAGNSMVMGLAEGAVSAGMGAYLMSTGCPNAAKHMECIMGASLVSAGATDAVQAQGYGNTGSQIAAGSPGVGTGDPGTGGAGLDPFMQGLLNTANQIAAGTGSTLQDLANQGDAAAADGGGGLGSFASQLPQSVKDGMKKAGEAAAAHYRVSAVAMEDRGGGKQKDEGGLDLSSLLSGLKNDRGPASIAGLQKSLNGEPIGVAQDNIFKQVTRKYQSKIASRTFLP
jgi:hypothetical protein